jgi:hypothetical protein
MSISTLKSSVTLLAVLVGTIALPCARAQTPAPAKKPNATTPAKPAPAAAKPAPAAAKPAPAAPNAAPARQATLAPAVKTNAAPPAAAPASNATKGRPLPGRTAMPVQTTAGTASTAAGRGNSPGMLATGGKGAAIGNAAAGAPASNTALAPSVNGRPAIPVGQTRGGVVVPGNRGPIPTTASGAVVPASSTQYLNSSSGRSPIPGYGSSPAAASGSGAAPVAGPNGSLGTFQWGPGMITIYGCTRQGTQVLCDTDFNNQNQHSTQVNTAWWGDMYMVDQNGDRHQRASAYFVNGAGEPREVLDIPYGQSARYIMVFNDFSPNVATAGLHSAYGKIDIENMALDGSGGGSVQGADQSQAAAAGNSAVGNSVNGMKDSVKNTGKQRAGEARDKALDKANGSLQKMMDRIPH